jgi:uncharacterized protein YndB with AHSA1/START domain
MEPLVQSIVINRPIEEVFDVATCQERCLVWRGPILATKKSSDGPVGVGSTYEHKVKFLGITVEAKPVITAWEPPHRAEFENRTGPVSYDSTFTFEVTEQGTKVTTRIQAKPGGAFGHIPERLVHSAITRQHKADLEALKELLENATEIKV